MSAIRFTKGDSMAATKSTKSFHKPSEPHKPGGRSASGQPGYIKTTTDRSSGRMKRGMGSAPVVNGPHEIPIRKGPDRSKIQSADMARGSMDRSYKATSTGHAGKLHAINGPQAPASRGTGTNTDGKRKMSGGLGFKNPAAPSKNWKGTTSKGKSGSGANGTMESLVGKTPTGNIAGRKKSMMY